MFEFQYKNSSQNSRSSWEGDPGKTQTLPLAIYAVLQQPGGEAEAARLAMLSFLLALLGLAAAALLQRWAARRE